MHVTPARRCNLQEPNNVLRTLGYIFVQRMETPALTLSFLPRPPAVATFSSASSSSKVTSFGADSQKSKPLQRDMVTQHVDGSSQRECVLWVLSMKFELPRIQEDMATSLAITLLGHDLFLKSQVPACYELSSHLHTTFSALSDSLAWIQKHGKMDTVYLALVLGLTTGAPKTCVVLVLKGLSVKDLGSTERRPGRPAVFHRPLRMHL